MASIFDKVGTLRPLGVVWLCVIFLGVIHGRASSEDYKPGDTFEFTVPDGLETPAFYRFEMPFQQGPKCGPNSLYVVLQMVGIDCSYSDVLSSVHLSEAGSNLAELQASAQKFGLACEIRKNLRPEDIDSLPMPVVLHLRGSVAKRDGRRNLDHFVLIAGNDPVAPSKGYLGVDSNNGTLTRFKKETLARSISGFALVITDPSRAIHVPMAADSFLPRMIWMIAVALILVNAVTFGLYYRVDSTSCPAK